MPGQVVFGEKYFRRPNIEAKIWRQLKKGSHLLLLAPRRVGKTSVLRYLEDNPEQGFIFLYTIVQSCNTEIEIYQAMLDSLYAAEFIGKISKFGKKARIGSPAY